jgi:hypothetical protein
MALQYISDNAGRHTAVIIPIAEWNVITAKHQDLKEMMEKSVSPKNAASSFRGLLTDEETEKYHQYIKKARGEWDRDI